MGDADDHSFHSTIFGLGLDPPESDDIDKRAYLVGLTVEAASRAVEGVIFRFIEARSIRRWGMQSG
jgi:hypothetical protein